MKLVKYFVLYIAIVSNLFSLDAHFENILLIINFNHAHYESIPLLKKIYKPFFNNIIFYGPSKHPEVVEFHHYKGYFSYLCIADAMEKYPNQSGYLFLMDDCILHPWFIRELDITKIWYSSIMFHLKEKGNPINIMQGSSATTWVWWATQWGLKPTIKTFEEIHDHYKHILEMNWGKSTVVSAFSDLAYIPSKYQNNFIELAKIFGKHRVFLEIALPTIMNCISLKSEWIWLSGQGTYGKPLLDYNKNAVFNHPIKLSSNTHRAFIDKFFTQKIDEFNQH